MAKLDRLKKDVVDALIALNKASKAVASAEDAEIAAELALDDYNKEQKNG